MSAIPTKQIDGDVAVGRNVSAGGDANIQGNARVGHDLVVEGWLEAKNIKGPNKGLFRMPKLLMMRYPLPHDGWWALVGTTLPAALWVAEGGSWINTGKTAGNPTLECEQYNAAVAELDAELNTLTETVDGHSLSIEQIRTQINTIGISVSSLTNKVTGLEENMRDYNVEIAGIDRILEEFKGSKGKPDGLAPLGSDGRVPARYLPGSLDDVKEFDGFTDYNGEIVGTPSTDRYVIKFNTTFGCFMAYEEATGSCYTDWEGSDGYGALINYRHIPDSDKVYVDRTTNKTYRWSGTQMTVIGSDLALGHTESTAFPGDEGLQLQEELEDAKSELGNANAYLGETSAQLNRLHILPCEGEWDGTGEEPTSGIWLCPNGKGGVHFRSFGTTQFYRVPEYRYNDTTTQTYMPGCMYRMGDGLYRIVNNKLTMVGSASGDKLTYADLTEDDKADLTGFLETSLPARKGFIEALLSDDVGFGNKLAADQGFKNGISDGLLNNSDFLTSLANKFTFWDSLIKAPGFASSLIRKTGFRNDLSYALAGSSYFTQKLVANTGFTSALAGSSGFVSSLLKNSEFITGLAYNSNFQSTFANANEFASRLANSHNFLFCLLNNASGFVEPLGTKLASNSGFTSALATDSGFGGTLATSNSTFKDFLASALAGHSIFVNTLATNSTFVSGIAPVLVANSSFISGLKAALATDQTQSE